MYPQYLLSISLMVAAVIGSAISYSRCPSGWIRYRHSCYHFAAHRVSWYEAWIMCKIYDGYLAEITSRAENNFVARQGKKHRLSDFWLGATDDFLEGQFKWLNSKKHFSYNNWHSVNPSNSNGNEHCLEMLKNKKWNDDSCHVHNPYVCEKGS